MNPSDARTQFRLRGLKNGAIALAIFVPLAIAAALLLAGILLVIADVILIATLAYLFFGVMEKRAIKLKCRHCQGNIATNTPWKCGFCKAENRRVNDFPFVHQCADCGAEPKAYQCHHEKCGKLIFLSDDELTANYATCLNLGTSALPSRDAERSEQKADLLHQIEMADLNAKLAENIRRSELGKPKLPAEEIEESFNRHYARLMGSEEYARHRRAKIAVELKDDPEMLRRANEAVDAWLISKA